jgi:hypothetical protein
MNHSQATSARTPATAGPLAAGTVAHPRPRTGVAPMAAPATRPEALELRDLLEANLHALRALHEEHQRMVQTSLRTIDPAHTELRRELRAIGSARAPWVRAMSETRALLFVALRELIVGDHESELSMAMSRQPADPHRAG